MSNMLSITVPSFMSEHRLPGVVQKITSRMEEENISFEILLIDDGSTDDSYRTALDLEQRLPYVRAYRMSRNYTSPYVQFAGLQLSRGNCAVVVPDDLQRPLDVVVRMYREWEKGAKIVIAHHDKRNDGFFSDLFSRTYYAIMNRFSDIKFPPGGADGILADREVIDLINKEISPRNTTPTIEALRLGFEPVYFPYTRPSVKSKSRWTWRKKVKLASDSFFSSSNFPIRMITGLGLVVAIFSFVLILAIVGAKLFSDNSLFGLPIQGWATIVVLISFFNGLVLFSLGIVAAYIWRIYEEVKGRPGYVIRSKKDEV